MAFKSDFLGYQFTEAFLSARSVLQTYVERTEVAQDVLEIILIFRYEDLLDLMAVRVVVQQGLKRLPQVFAVIPEGLGEGCASRHRSQESLPCPARYRTKGRL